MTRTEGMLNQLLARISAEEPKEHQKKRTCLTLALTNTIQTGMIVTLSVSFLIIGVFLASMVHETPFKEATTMNYGAMIENTQLSITKTREKIKLFNEQMSDMQTQLEKISREFEHSKLHCIRAHHYNHQ
jgi:hypothetical protein